MKIKALATTVKGQTSFTILNPEAFKEQIRDLNGMIEIEVRKVSEDATEQQKAKLYILSNIFKNHESKQGNNVSDNEIEKFFVRNVGKFLKPCFDDLNKEETSKLIQEVEIFLTEQQITF